MARTSYLTALLTVLVAASLPALAGGNGLLRLISIASGSAPPRPDTAPTGEIEKIEGVHLEGSGGNFQSTDGQGYLWDISGLGTVPDGSRDAYDGGMMLVVDGTPFGGGETVISADSHEMQIGLWRRGAVAVWRRVYVDQQRGYCRWIDIFQNTSDEPIVSTVTYASDLGGSTKEAYLPDSDRPDAASRIQWGMATDDDPRSDRPSLAHVWGTPNSSDVPTVAAPLGTDAMTFVATVELAAGETAAVCIFQAQRYAMADARRFVDEFDHDAELAKIHPALRQIIVNMQRNVLIAGPLALRRSDKADALVLQTGREMGGKLLNEQFVIEAFYGTITLQADQVIGLGRVDPGDTQVHVALVDGQIIAGRLTSGPIQLQAEGETTMTVPVERVRSAAFAISDARPAEAPLDAACVTLRSGQRLAFLSGPEQFTYLTEHGELVLLADGLESIDLAATQERLHLATLADGSRLSGLLTDEQFAFILQIGPSLVVARDVVAHVQLAPPEEYKPEGAALRLKNSDVLYGRLADETLELATPYGTITVAAGDVSRLAAERNGRPGQVRIDPWEGPAVAGTLTCDVLSFELAGGMTIDILVGLVSSVDVPKPPDEPPPAEPDEDDSDQTVSGGEQTYIAQKGDSFWIIARKVYGEGQYWSLIANANPGVDPQTLKVGDELVIPPLPEEDDSTTGPIAPEPDIVEPDTDTSNEAPIEAPTD